MNTPCPFMSVKSRLLALLASSLITVTLLGAVVVGMAQPDGAAYAPRLVASGAAPAAAAARHNG